MKSFIFSVVDTKANAFLPPFILPNREMAKREFQFAANDPTHMFCRYPTDFTLMEIGKFDNETGEILSFTPPTIIGNAANFKINEDYQS